MADFNQTYLKTSGIEGGYTVDNGGRTYRGISFKAWGSDPLVKRIFNLLDTYRPRKGQIINNPTLDTLVKQFYKKNYWDRIYGDSISNQVVANFIYDFYVNSNSALSIINKAIGSTRGTYGFTEMTIQQLNNKPGWCYMQILAARKNWYNSIAKKSPKLKRYLPGWMARINMFPQLLNV